MRSPEMINSIKHILGCCGIPRAKYSSKKKMCVWCIIRLKSIARSLKHERYQDAGSVQKSVQKCTLTAL